MSSHFLLPVLGNYALIAQGFSEELWYIYCLGKTREGGSICVAMGKLSFLQAKDVLVLCLLEAQHTQLCR